MCKILIPIAKFQAAKVLLFYGLCKNILNLLEKFVIIAHYFVILHRLLGFFNEEIVRYDVFRTCKEQIQLQGL